MRLSTRRRYREGNCLEDFSEFRTASDLQMRGLAQKGKLVLLRWIHSGITRDSRFSVLNETDLGFFTELLGNPRVLTDEQRLIKYNRLRDVLWS